MAPEQGLQFVIQPQAIRNKCLEEARELMERCAPARAASTPSSSPSFSPSPAGSKVKDLVAKLTSIMLQVKVSEATLRLGDGVRLRRLGHVSYRCVSRVLESGSPIFAQWHCRGVVLSLAATMA